MRRGLRPGGFWSLLLVWILALWAIVDAGSGLLEAVRLVSIADTSAVSWPSLIAACATSLVFVGVGLLLVMARPNSVTWGFFLLACGYTIAQFGSLGALLPAAWAIPYRVSRAVAIAMAIGGGSIFAARFPNGTKTRVGMLLERVGVPVALVIAALYLARLLLAASDPIAPLIKTAYEVALLAILALNVAVGIYRRAESRGEERARGQWVISGSTIGVGAVFADTVMRLLRVPGFDGSALDTTLSVAIIVIPLSVAYAVLRHRVIDVRFAINRALVFGLITTGSILAFSLIEWFLGKELEATRLALDVEVGLALAIGFSFDRLKGLVDRGVERAFFRRQHAAAERLRRAVEALPHAGAPETVDELMISEPSEAYGLSSAALFRKTLNGSFERTASRGWDNGCDSVVTSADPLLAYVAASIRPLELDDTRYRLKVPSGELRPEVAVPIAARHELLAFALYGPHESGEMIDPEERSTLGDLAVAAAAAYDHLEAADLKRGVHELRRRRGIR